MTAQNNDPELSHSRPDMYQAGGGLKRACLLLIVAAAFLQDGQGLTPSSPRHGNRRQRAPDLKHTSDPRQPPRRRRRSVAASVSRVEEQSTAEARSFRKSQGSNVADRLPAMSPAQIEREIVMLGRKGRIDQALDIYESLEQPLIRQMNAIVDACSRARPVRLELAFNILKNAAVPPNVYTFGALMNVCARAGNCRQAVQLLQSMEEDYGVTPNAVVYNTAVSACDRADPPRPDLARSLLQEARGRGLRMSVVGYNAAISSCAHAGDWQGAVELLSQMEQAEPEGMIPRPDAVSYGTLLSAFERGQQWNRILEYAEYMQNKGLALDALGITSVLHACQSLGLADEAVRYLNLMKQGSASAPKRCTAGWEIPGGHTPLEGPDAVAYLLAVSACARGGSWIQGIKLLDEYCLTPGIQTDAQIDVNIYTAAMKGCEYAGQWQEAFLLLDRMRKDQVEPNEVAFATVIGACASACAKQYQVGESPQHLEPLRKALRLLHVMGKDDTIASPTTLVYNAAIRACAEAHDLKRALKLYDRMLSQEVEPDMFTFGSLMTACERVESMEGINKVFGMLKNQGIGANDVIYGAAISCCRKSGEAERALLLLQKMIKEGLQPNVATFNTVLMAQAESRNTANLALVYKYLMGASSAAAGENSDPTLVKPNRQTFNLMIRAFADKKEPKDAESVLRHMRKAGFVPDVDLYTLVVSAYERTGQPLQALRLMESMNSEGYNFYEDKVLNAAFKRALKMANMVGRRLSADEQPQSLLDEQDGGAEGCAFFAP